MVNTRSQLAKSNITETSRMDSYSDNESEYSVPEVLTREHITDFDIGDLINLGKITEQNSVDQPF